MIIQDQLLPPQGIAWERLISAEHRTPALTTHWGAEQLQMFQALVLLLIPALILIAAIKVAGFRVN